jgi:alpha-L-rhamnosidase
VTDRRRDRARATGRVILGCCAALGLGAVAAAAPVRLVDQRPVAVRDVAPGVVLVDFGRVAFGNVRLLPAVGTAGEVTVHFGEAFFGGRIDRTPPGTVRYGRAEVDLTGGTPVIVAPPADERNTGHPLAVRTPPEWGVVLPFRWVEVEGWPGAFHPELIVRRAAFAATWDDEAASFASSDAVLDRIWELCRYSIKGTTFAGVYVDGDRERIAYEADAYLNQLSHYAVDRDVQMARDTFDRLLEFPTWPTEWASHMIFMAHADWMQTGDRSWLAARYESLKPRLLLDRVRADGLVASTEAQIERGDIVDWPAGERDGFVFRPVNTVVNAFHLRSLVLMAELAAALGKDAEAREYRGRERSTRRVFQETLFDAARGLYRDGEGTDHASLHANLFPLAFGLVPAERRPAVIGWVAGRGMACSVYAAQYLLEALFEHGADRRALELITAPTDRSWKHMLHSGTTITWEAWDVKYKPNQDWNHAWGAAPANLLPRYVVGARPLAPGWTRALVRPHPGALTSARGKIPTPRGPIAVRWEKGDRFRMHLELPPGTAAQVQLPGGEGTAGVWIDGKAVAAARDGAWWTLKKDVDGSVRIEVR